MKMCFFKEPKTPEFSRQRDNISSYITQGSEVRIDGGTGITKEPWSGKWGSYIWSPTCSLK